MKDLNSIKWFGRGDTQTKINEKTGEVEHRIVSEYPAWYFDVQIEQLEEEIASKERDVAAGRIKGDMSLWMADLEKQKFNLKRILEDKPNLTGNDKDELKKVYDDLSGKISDAMETRLDMHRGTVNAQRTFRKLNDKTVPVSTRQHMMYKNLGINPVKGKISVKDAERAYKIIGRSLGENTMTERLRKDHGQRSYSIPRSLEEMEQDSPR